MSVIRKFLAVVAAVLSIVFIFLGIRAIGLALSNDQPTTAFDRVAWWLVVAAPFGLSFLLMRFAKKTLG